MKFRSTASPSARYYVDPAANAVSVKFAEGELETDDPDVIDALIRLADAGEPIEYDKADKPKRQSRAEKAAEAKAKAEAAKVDADAKAEAEAEAEEATAEANGSEPQG